MIKRRRIRGAIAIEAAIGIPVLLFVIMLWVELCLLFFAISSTEHAFAEAVFYAKKVDIENSIWGDYTDVIDSKLWGEGTSGPLWSETTVRSSVQINAAYFKNFDSLHQCSNLELSANDCPSSSSDSRNGAIAIFSLNYIYKPLVLGWFPRMLIRREIITVQEYERCALSVSGRDCD